MAIAGYAPYQPPRPNAMGQAIVQGASNIGSSMYQAAQIKQQKQEKLVTMALQFLPKLANDPTMLAQFTGHQDFAQILGAFNQVGLGSVFKYDAGSGAYNVNIPADIPSMEEEYSKALSKRYTPGSPEWMSGVLDYKRAGVDPYARAVATQKADADVTTPEEQAALDARDIAAGAAKNRGITDYKKAFDTEYAGALRPAAQQRKKAKARMTTKTPGFLGFGSKTSMKPGLPSQEAFQTRIARKRTQRLNYGNI